MTPHERLLLRLAQSEGDYQFSWRPSAEDGATDPGELPESGTLEEALAAAQASGATCVLLDEHGFQRGTVKPDGNYQLT